MPTNFLLRITLVIGFIWLARPAAGQLNQSRALNGAENVTVDSTANRVYYEQRLYRNPLIGMLELRDALPGIVEFVPYFQGVAIARYRLDSTAATGTTLLSGAERAQINCRSPFSQRRYKFDFRLQPEVIADFGYKLAPVQTKTSLLLQTQLYLLRGMSLNFGVLLPIINNYDTQSLNIRPAPIFLNQFLALGRQNFLSASVGLFYGDQYGVNVQYRWANLLRPWSFGIESGLTGYFYFPDRGIYYQPMRNVMLLGDLAYRFRRNDLTVKLTGGRFPYGDQGVRMDLIRQFTFVDVGVYAAATSNGSTAGFNFAVPIPPGRIVQTQRFRLRSSEEFRWEYTYNSSAPIGTRYRVMHQLDALLRQYHADYIRNQLQN